MDFSRKNSVILPSLPCKSNPNFAHGGHLSFQDALKITLYFLLEILYDRGANSKERTRLYGKETL
jgi:hypothetical protein